MNVAKRKDKACHWRLYKERIYELQVDLISLQTIIWSVKKDFKKHIWSFYQKSNRQKIFFLIQWTNHVSNFFFILELSHFPFPLKNSIQLVHLGHFAEQDKLTTLNDKFFVQSSGLNYNQLDVQDFHTTLLQKLQGALTPPRSMFASFWFLILVPFFLIVCRIFGPSLHWFRNSTLAAHHKNVIQRQTIFKNLKTFGHLDEFLNLNVYSPFVYSCWPVFHCSFSFFFFLCFVLFLPRILRVLHIDKHIFKNLNGLWPPRWMLGSFWLLILVPFLLIVCLIFDPQTSSITLQHPGCT